MASSYRDSGSEEGVFHDTTLNDVSMVGGSQTKLFDPDLNKRKDFIPLDTIKGRPQTAQSPKKNLK